MSTSTATDMPVLGMTSTTSTKDNSKFTNAPEDVANKSAEEKEYSETDRKEAFEACNDSNNDNKPAKRRKKMNEPLASSQQRKLNFAQYLMELLEMEDVKPILHWMDDGEGICFEDTVRFAEEVMPKYFSDTKYKSFMVRMKRWGFKHITPSEQDNVSESAKIMQCELFLRDQPELCLLMGDERRADRIKVAKMIYKAATEKKASEDAAVSSLVHTKKTEKKTAEDAAALSLARASRSSTISDSEMAMLSYQRQLKNLETYKLLATQGRQLSLSGVSFSPQRLLDNIVSSNAYATAHLVASSLAQAARSFPLSDSQMIMLQNQNYIQNLPTYNLLSTQGRQLGLSGMSSSPRGVLGSSVSPPFSSRCIGDAGQGERAIESMPMVQIERDIQSCLETIAAQENRLSVLMTMKEMKPRMGMGRNSGMSSGVDI